MFAKARENPSGGRLEPPPGDPAVVGINLLGVTSCPLPSRRRARVDEVC